MKFELDPKYLFKYIDFEQPGSCTGTVNRLFYVFNNSVLGKPVGTFYTGDIIEVTNNSIELLTAYHTSKSGKTQPDILSEKPAEVPSDECVPRGEGRIYTWTDSRSESNFKQTFASWKELYDLYPSL